MRLVKILGLVAGTVLLGLCYGWEGYTGLCGRRAEHG